MRARRVFVKTLAMRREYREKRKEKRGKWLPLLRRLVSLGALCLLLAACTYTYIPPIPPVRTPEAVLDVRGSPGLTVASSQLELSVQLTEVPAADWLNVQWFSPQNQQVASSALWITPEDIGFSRTFYLPPDVKLTTGEWRAIVSYRGRIVRQFALDVNP